MTDRPPRLSLPRSTFAGLVAACVAVISIGVVSYLNDVSRVTNANLVRHTLQVREALEQLLSAVKDAETGERGYLLTGEEEYLEPFEKSGAGLKVQLAQLEALIGDDAGQKRRLALARSSVEQKLAELKATIELRRAGDTSAALAAIRTHRGKIVMDQLREVVAEMGAEERRLLESRQADWSETVENTRVLVFGGSGFLLLLILATAYLLARDHLARETEAWLKAGQAALALELQGDHGVPEISRRVLEYLTRRVGALAGAFYAGDAGRLYRRVAAVATGALHRAQVERGEGLTGRAVEERRLLHVRDVPKGYFPVGSTLGSADPKELIISPLAVDGITPGVIELAFFRRVEPAEAELLERSRAPIAVALASAQQRQRVQELLEETQRQSEELQRQQEELQSQAEELEANNVELAQANKLLADQTAELEAQRDEVGRSRDAAEKASRFKSEFLANMSHELRTPLNSALILARLLADNREKTLTSEQVRSAETIYSAGNDLLMLINDILDLSKIEAGRVELQVEPIKVEKLLRSLEQAFAPVAAEKQLALSARALPGAPEELSTDLRRLEQVLKNLLSNACKFTEAGSVELTVRSEGRGVRFDVRDTGIGIAPDKHAVIFEAFRQADGTTARKFGGTGLGLSISRELAHLMGGTLSVHSAPGEGSTFSLTLPLEAPAQRRAPAPPSRTRTSEIARAPRPRPAPAPAPFPDDRAALGRGRAVLVVEDDPKFARILYDLAHEQGFDCLVASTGEAGLQLARELLPHGVLLDIALPDGSGLMVLEQLKRDGATRHIPVHIVSASDSRQAALELGAVGYALKPVARDELVEALKKLEAQHARRVRRVLVVEDDRRQQEAVRQLLETTGVSLEAASTLAEALLALEKESFDCVVLDLQLPDGSGYELLEKMAEGTRWSFPPVIVYTGRPPEPSDEERLKHLARSVVVKGARSPERLLDEVTLFLHQVEAQLPPEHRRMLQTARARDTAFEGRRILVVEDDVRNVFALSRILEPRGAKVEIARNGREALDTLARPGRFDLVLMDLMMPEMDGLTAIREIRKKKAHQRLPVIALTAKAMPDDRDQAVAAGANDYMAKPFEVEKLVSLCRVWLPR